MTNQENSLNWFEISVVDLARAKKFYEQIFGIKMETWSMPGIEMEVFPGDPMNGKVYGCLCKSPDHKPSADGVKLYLNGNPDLGVVLDRVQSAGGKVVMPKTKIDDNVGHMAFFVDTEGNAIGLHSNK